VQPEVAKWAKASASEGGFSSFSQVLKNDKISDKLCLFCVSVI